MNQFIDMAIVTDSVRPWWHVRSPLLTTLCVLVAVWSTISLSPGFRSLIVDRVSTITPGFAALEQR